MLAYASHTVLQATHCHIIFLRELFVKKWWVWLQVRAFLGKYFSITPQSETAPSSVTWVFWNWNNPWSRPLQCVTRSVQIPQNWSQGHARPTVIFRATEHHHQLTSTKLCCLVTEAQAAWPTCPVVTQPCPNWEWNCNLFIASRPTAAPARYPQLTYNLTANCRLSQFVGFLSHHRCCNETVEIADDILILTMCLTSKQKLTETTLSITHYCLAYNYINRRQYQKQRLSILLSCQVL